MVTFGAFLPVRWFFYGYVTHHIIPNIGMVTLFAIIIFLLIRSGKLGFVGRAFNRQMIRFAASKTFKRVLIFSLALSLYTGIPLYFMERGEFEYQEELQMFDAISIKSAYLRQYIVDTTEPLEVGGSVYMGTGEFCDLNTGECVIDYNNITYEGYKFVMLNNELPSKDVWDKVNNMTLMEGFDHNSDLANNYDFLMSSAMHLANEQSDGWTSHFSTVWFVEQVEAVGLYFLYRRWYLKKTDSKPWLGIYNKNLKLIMYKTKDKDKFYSGRHTKPEDKGAITKAIGILFIGMSFIVARFATNEPILGVLGIAIIGVSMAYVIKHSRKPKTKIQVV
jgi:hypothetical protein